MIFSNASSYNILVKNFIKVSAFYDKIFIKKNKTYVQHICMYYSEHFVYLEKFV